MTRYRLEPPVQSSCWDSFIPFFINVDTVTPWKFRSTTSNWSGIDRCTYISGMIFLVPWPVKADVGSTVTPRTCANESSSCCRTRFNSYSYDVVTKSHLLAIITRLRPCSITRWAIVRSMWVSFFSQRSVTTATTCALSIASNESRTERSSILFEWSRCVIQESSWYLTLLFG